MIMAERLNGEQCRLSIKNITGPDPAKFTESTEGSGPGLRNLSENDYLSVSEFSPGPVQIGKQLF